MRSASIPATCERFWAAYLSIDEGFLRKPRDLGLSNVDTDDPETRDGVRITGGGGRPSTLDESLREVAAEATSDGGATAGRVVTAAP